MEIRKHLDFDRNVYLKVWEDKYNQHMCAYLNENRTLKIVGISPQHAGKVKAWLKRTYPESFTAVDIYQTIFPSKKKVEPKLNKIERFIEEKNLRIFRINQKAV